MRLRIFLIISLIFLCSVCSATDYYCGAGELQTTIADVNVLSLASGDNVFFNRGETFNDARLALKNGVIYSSYGVGNKPVFNGTFDYGNIYGNSLSSCTLNGLKFTNGKVNYTNIWIQNCSNITIQNCDFSGSNVDLAIHIYCNSATLDMYNIVINNCAFTAVGKLDSVRFSLDSSTNVIRNSILSNCTFTNEPVNAIRIYTPQAIADVGKYAHHITFSNNTINTVGNLAFALQGGEYLTVTGNTCIDMGSISTPNVNALWLADVHYSLIEKNSVSNVYTSIPDGVGIMIDRNYSDDNYGSHDNIIRKNIVTGCNATYSAGINNFSGANNQYYDNIVYNCQIGLALSWSASTGCAFYNNTVYNVTYFGFWLERGAAVCVVKNNIFHTATNGIFIQDVGSNVPIEDYNNYYNIGGVKIYDSIHSVEIPIGSNSITSNPLLTSDYRLTSTSPCKDTGITLTDVTDDYEGNPRPMGASTDIGAYEWFKCKIKNATLKGCQL